MESNQVNAPVGVEKVYPSIPDSEGWFFENDGMEALGVEKKMDPDDEEEVYGYRVSLSKGRRAILKELTRKQRNQAANIAGANAKGADAKSQELQDRIMCATIALCAKFYDREGKELNYVMEDIMGLGAKDSNRLDTACSLINF